ncbi:MAG: AAA family ATPase [Verrucomicrobia bacterium]|nr:AAA family ATPase [Verrucomicrobiota bacterium]
MKKRLPIGISDFRKLIDGGYAYVDKSLLIAEIIDEGTEVALIPRPRRFGKTLNLSMLRYFFEHGDEDTSYLFKDLQIWQHATCRALQGQFPVIFLTFKDIRHSSWESTFEHFSLLLAKECQRHRYLLEGDLLGLEEQEQFRTLLKAEANPTLCATSLLLLSEWLSLYHKQPVVLLIDEYDTPVHSAYLNNYYDPTIEFLRNLLSSCLKDNPHLRLGVLTGILRIAKESVFSGLNNVRTFTLLNETFQDKFGLLESEVEELLAPYGLLEQLPQFREWYDGYRIGSCADLYNPWSVLNCIAEKGELAPYWVNTSTNALIKEVVAQGGGDLKSDFEILLQGGSISQAIEEGTIFSDLRRDSGSIWMLLLYSGYLTIDAKPTYGTPCPLRIPNREIYELYQLMVIEWFSKSITLFHYHALLNSLTEGDVATFSQLFQEFMISSVSVFDVPAEESEKIYHAFVLGLLIGLKDRYTIKSNREGGFGRYDVMLFPKNPQGLGIVMEFKKAGRSESLEQAAEAALQQIAEKQYAQELQEQKVSRILCLGLAFKGKEVHIESSTT